MISPTTSDPCLNLHPQGHLRTQLAPGVAATRLARAVMLPTLLRCRLLKN